MDTSILNMQNPIAAARLVRIQRCAWPGCYEVALLTNDGGLLCPDCVAAEFHQISYSHRHNIRDGWKPSGLIHGAEMEGPHICSHCCKEMFGE